MSFITYMSKSQTELEIWISKYIFFDKTQLQIWVYSRNVKVF